MISEHATQWLGFPVKEFDPENAETADYARTIYRLALDWDSEMDFPTLFSKFIQSPRAAESPAIIIGRFSGEDPGEGFDDVVQLLVSARTRLPNLRGIFIADLISEENEISWIVLGDVSPVLVAYPQLEHFRVRETGELTLGQRVAHDSLKSLTLESGGLPRALFEEVVNGQLPALEH